MGYFYLDDCFTDRCCLVSDEIIKLLNESAARYSACVIDTAIQKKQGRLVIEVYIDAEEGVTSELCSNISRAVGEALDTKELTQSAYELVVSSPGVDRPLKFPWQYKKHIGRKLEIKTMNDGTVLNGKLLNIIEEGVTLQVGKTGESVKVPFGSIQHVIVKSPW